MIALGSRGDVTPMLLLGQALRERGHEVRLATYENFADWVREAGLHFYPIRGDSEAILRSPAGLRLAESGENLLRFVPAVRASFGVQARGYADDLTPLTALPTDIILNQLPGGLFGYDLAEAIGAPLVRIAVMPMTPTSAQPMLGFPYWLRRVPGYNRLTYRLAEQTMWRGYRREINAWRTQALGLRPLRWQGFMGRRYARPVPTINGFSRHIIERPSDWGADIHLTGFWPWQPPIWEPDPALARFLEAGDPPVFITFGSMPIRDPGRATGHIIAAVQAAGCRAILQRGWAGLGDAAMSENVHVVDFVSYAWLMPRVAGAVHHGGSGTTASGLRAGTPTLVVPFIFDQFFWGRQVARLRLGPAPLPFRHLSAGRLAGRLHQLTEERLFRERAREIGARLRAEDGVATAVALVEAYGNGQAMADRDRAAGSRNGAVAPAI